MNFRASFSTPVHDHGEIIIDLAMIAGNSREKWIERVGSFHIPTNRIRKVEHGHESPSSLELLYWKCHPESQPQNHAKTVTVQTTGALWCSARTHFDSSLRRKTKTVLQEAQRILTGPCTIRLIFTVKVNNKIHPIEFAFKDLETSIKNEAAPGGPLGVYFHKTPKAHHLNYDTMTDVDDLPKLPLVAARNRFASRDQQAVYTQYGLLHEFDHQKSADSALSNLIGVRAVVIPQDLSKHPETGDFIKYFLLVKPDASRKDQMKFLPPVGTKLFIQPQVEVLRGRRVKQMDGYHMDEDLETDTASETDGQSHDHLVQKHVIDAVYRAESNPVAATEQLLQIIKDSDRLRIANAFGRLIDIVKGTDDGKERLKAIIEFVRMIKAQDVVCFERNEVTFGTDIWVSAVRVDQISTLWNPSYHVWDITMGLSDRDQGPNSAPVKFNFPEIQLDASVEECKQQIMSGDMDFYVKFKVDTPTSDYRAQMRSLEKLMNPHKGKQADRPSDISRHAMEDSQLMSFRKYLPLGQRIPAFAKLSTKMSQLEQPARKYFDSLSESHKDLLSHLAMQKTFFVPVVGAPGTGKTAVMVLATTLAAAEALTRQTYASILEDGKSGNGSISKDAVQGSTKSFAKTLVQCPTNRLCDELCARYSAMASTVLKRDIKVVRLLNYRTQLVRASDKHRQLEERTFHIDAQDDEATTDAFLETIRAEKLGAVLNDGNSTLLSTSARIELRRATNTMRQSSTSRNTTSVPHLTLERLVLERLNAPYDQRTQNELELNYLLAKDDLAYEDQKATIKGLLKKVAGRILSHAHVVVGTTVALSYPWLSEYFRADICVQEEAGLAREPETWSLLAHQDPLVCLLVGDPNQFAPLILSRDNFVAAQSSEATPNPFADQLATPFIQRMDSCDLVDKWVRADNRSLGWTSKLVSEVFYNGRLTGITGNGLHRMSSLQRSFQSLVRQRYNPDHDGPVLVLSLEGAVETQVVTSYFNEGHLEEGIDFLKSFLPTLREKLKPSAKAPAAVPPHLRHTAATEAVAQAPAAKNPETPTPIGAIVTPYRAAANEWNKALVMNGIHDVDVFTPRTAQGVDREFILVDLVRTSRAGDTSDRHLLTVALSRAKSCMVVLLNKETANNARERWLARVLQVARKHVAFSEMQKAVVGSTRGSGRRRF